MVFQSSPTVYIIYNKSTTELQSYYIDNNAIRTYYYSYNDPIYFKVETNIFNIIPSYGPRFYVIPSAPHNTPITLLIDKTETVHIKIINNKNTHFQLLFTPTDHDRARSPYNS